MVEAEAIKNNKFSSFEITFQQIVQDITIDLEKYGLSMSGIEWVIKVNWIKNKV